MTVRPSRTTNRLHFADLDPIRFEDLCLGLVYPIRPWLEIRHYGRLGGDGGVDILALEPTEEGPVRTWFIQCRRYSKASRSTLKKAVDDALSKSASPPFVLLVVLACDVTKEAHESYQSYAATRGVGTPILWTASALEARLYGDRKDLLFAYFGISLAERRDNAEAELKKSLVTKRKVQKALLKTKFGPEDRRDGPWSKFIDYEAIIHSVEDKSYPEVDTTTEGISGWFKIELCDLYHGGIEFILRVERAAADSLGRWALVPPEERDEVPEFRYFNVFVVGRLPYRNIVDIDPRGDEYYRCPHIYCRFADRGTPWEAFVYRYTMHSAEYPMHVECDPITYEALAKGQNV